MSNEEFEKKIEIYFKNKEILKFTPIVKVENKSINVTFQDLEPKYNTALSNLVREISLEMIQIIKAKYEPLNDGTREVLKRNVDSDLQSFMTMLLTYGYEAFNMMVDGSIAIARKKAFYEEIHFVPQKGWMYNNQIVKFEKNLLK